MTLLQFSQYAFWAVIWLTWLKTITGYHFPWEICPCCGTKWGEHGKNGHLPNRRWDDGPTFSDWRTDDNGFPF